MLLHGAQKQAVKLDAKDVKAEKKALDKIEGQLAEYSRKAALFKRQAQQESMVGCCWVPQDLKYPRSRHASPSGHAFLMQRSSAAEDLCLAKGLSEEPRPRCLRCPRGGFQARACRPQICRQTMQTKGIKAGRRQAV